MLKNSNVVILLGAGRSGTTLLYKILSAHKNVAYLSHYQSKFPGLPVLSLLQRALNKMPAVKRRSWFKQGGGAYFDERRSFFQSLIPMPVEAEQVYRRCGVPLYPSISDTPTQQSAHALQLYFDKVLRYSGGKVILTKRTANNRRIKWLRAAFPNAKYIHLIRDGRAVAYSLLRVGWWNDHVLFWTGKTPRVMVNAGADPLELAARNWVQEMQRLEAGIALLDPDDILELRYETLLSEPQQELHRVLDFMGLAPDSDPDFWSLIEHLNLKPKPEAWMEKCSDRDKQALFAIQGDMLERWGFC